MNIMDYITTTTILFFLLQFINVILSTMKTVLTVKANKFSSTAEEKIVSVGGTTEVI